MFISDKSSFNKSTLSDRDLCIEDIEMNIFHFEIFPPEWYLYWHLDDINNVYKLTQIEIYVAEGKYVNNPASSTNFTECRIVDINHNSQIFEHSFKELKEINVAIFSLQNKTYLRLSSFNLILSS